eukprot:Sdes_comp15693_c0_seq2m4720
MKAILFEHFGKESISKSKTINTSQPDLRENISPDSLLQEMGSHFSAAAARLAHDDDDMETFSILDQSDEEDGSNPENYSNLPLDGSHTKSLPSQNDSNEETSNDSDSDPSSDPS